MTVPPPPPEPPPAPGYAPAMHHSPQTYATGYAQTGPLPPAQAGHVAQPGQPHTVPATAVASQVAEYVAIPGVGADKLAGMGERLLARLIDIPVLSIGSGLIYAVFALIGGVIGRIGAASASDPGAAMMGSAAGGLSGFLLAAALVTTVLLVYEIVMVGLFGATVGKMLMKVKVVRAQNGRVPGLPSGFLRYIIPGLCGYIPFVGWLGTLICYLSPFFDGSSRRQGWHDKVAGTVVVKS